MDETDVGRLQSCLSMVPPQPQLSVIALVFLGQFRHLKYPRPLTTALPVEGGAENNTAHNYNVLCYTLLCQLKGDFLFFKTIVTVRANLK